MMVSGNQRRREIYKFKESSIESGNIQKLEFKGIARGFSFVKSTKLGKEISGSGIDVFMETKFDHNHPTAEKVCKFTLFNVHQFGRYVFSYIKCYCTYENYLILSKCEACYVECIYSERQDAFIVTDVLNWMCLEKYEISSSNDCAVNHKPAGHCPGYTGKKTRSIKKCLKILNEEIDSKLTMPDITDTGMFMATLERRYKKLGEFCLNVGLPYDFIMNALKEVLYGHMSIGGSANQRDLLLTTSSVFYLHTFMTVAYVSLIYNDYQKISFDYFMSVSESIYNDAILAQIKYEDYSHMDDVDEVVERNKTLCYYHNIHDKYMKAFSNNVPDIDLCQSIYNDIMKRYYPEI